MAAIFSFDEEDGEHNNIPGLDPPNYFEKERDQQQKHLPPDLRHNHATRLPIDISRNSSTSNLQSVNECTDSFEDLALSSQQHTSNLLSTSRQQQRRLGTSYEVGIDHDYVSSFANENRHQASSNLDDLTICTTTTSTNDNTNATTTLNTRGIDASGPRSRKMSPDDFAPLKVLGQGAYGKVLLVRHKQSGTLFAQKQLKKASMVVEQRKIEQTKSERSILESVRHPYIVRLFYALQDHSKLYLILEYAQGGELFTHLAAERMFSEDVAAFYVAEMALALEHLHKNVGVVYRDLKPENCLLDAEGHLVLTDFGLSKVSSEDADSGCNSLLGTPEYMAPEILLGKEYSYSVDWWSLGAVCFDLVTGSPPFTGNTYPKIVDKITKAKLHLPYYLSLDAKEFLNKLLKKEPGRRLGYKDMEKIKKMRFFRKIDWTKLEIRHPDIVPPIIPIVTDPELAENFSTEFTDMILSPDVRGGPGDRTGDFDEHFRGFSYTASHSFIERALTLN